MKYLKFCILIVWLSTLFSIDLISQNDTTISNSTLHKEILDMKYNLSKHSIRYHNGLYVQLFGLVLSGAGTFVSLENEDNKGLYLAAAGALVTLAGTITIISSHKYIGRAGAVNNGIGLVIQPR